MQVFADIIPALQVNNFQLLYLKKKNVISV